MNNFNIKKIKQQDYYRKYYEKNKERLKKYDKQWRQKNKEILKIKRQIYEASRKDIINKYQREYRAKNKKYFSNLEKKYYQKNKERYKNNIIHQIKITLRCRVYDALENNSKSKTTKELLGCSIEEVKKYLEKQFVEGMSWKNRGIKGWHIDHIKPCCSFDLSNPTEQKKCFHYTNLQPLWWYDNLSKGGKY